MTERLQGTIKFFKGSYGFIERENGKDIFFHLSALPQHMDSIEAGKSVTFEVGQSKKGPAAMNIQTA